MMRLRLVFSISMDNLYGNGLEITARTLVDAEICQRYKPLTVDDETSMHHVLKVAGKLRGIHLELGVISPPTEGKYTCGTIDLMDLGLVPADKIPDTSELKEPKPSGVGAYTLGGEAFLQYVVKMIQLVIGGQIDVTVTNALGREAVNMAGYHYSSHAGVCADYTKTPKYNMTLAHDELRVVHTSTHMPSRQACDLVKKDHALECICIANEGCKSLGIKEPEITVAGLNLHCGENDLFGMEEIREIRSTVDIALAEGIHTPDQKSVPADTVFSKALGGWYDIIVAMYHNQGYVPLKVRGFVYNRKEKHWGAVARINAILGLLIIRISVDHGTVFGHVDNGHANELSLINAMDYVIRIANAEKER